MLAAIVLNTQAFFGKFLVIVNQQSDAIAKRACQGLHSVESTLESVG